MLDVGVVLLVVGTALLIAEAHVVSYGVLGVSGLAAMVLGAALAVDAAGGGLALALVIAVTLGLAGATLLLAVIRRVSFVARRRASTGAEGLIGRTGVVRSAPAPLGQVFVGGELWRARPSLGDDEVLHAGEPIVVERVSGLTLAVRRAEEWELDP
jgi:membrane-bound serine protease (ClpP class)